MNPTRVAFLLATMVLVACEDSVGPDSERPFIDGTAADPQIGLVINSGANALRLFQVGNPDEVRNVELGASSAVTPTGLAIRGRMIAVPLGNAASVAVINAADQRIERFFLFPSGNATGVAFTEDGGLLLANTNTNVVGRVTLDQTSNAITQTVSVAPSPTDIEMVAGRALVLSGNLDDAFAPLGPGVVTALNPTTLEILGIVDTGGTNPNGSAVGPDGLLYVVNTHDFTTGSLAIINPNMLQRVALIEGIGPGPGAITINDEGLAFISSFSAGTFVFDTRNRTFVRGPDNPLCAPLPNGDCRGAFDAEAGEDGRVYQVFFGSASQGLSPGIFVYSPGSYDLTDSIPSGQRPTSIRVRRF